MTTIAQIQHRMSAFDTFARAHTEPDSLQKKWHTLFDTNLGQQSAKSFAEYYRKMKQTRKQRGGMAPLNYQMTSGSPNVSVYGRFPVEVDTDPASIRALDVYFHDALTKDCGNPAQAAAFPRPSSEMGSNQVGAGRKSRKNRNNRRTLRKMNRKNRKSNKRQRGGNLLSSLSMHPYISTAPPNVLQNAAHTVNGTPHPISGQPNVHGWNYVSHGLDGIVNPGLITPIGTSFKTLAAMDPYQTTQ